MDLAFAAAAASKDTAAAAAARNQTGDASGSWLALLGQA